MRLVERSLHACVNRWSNAAIIDITRKMTSATKCDEGNGCPLWTIGHSSKLLMSEALFFSELIIRTTFPVLTLRPAIEEI